MIYPSPIPSRELRAQLRSIYRDASVAVRELNAWRHLICPYEPLTRWVREGARVLDFGSGAGALVEHLRRSGRDAWGLELDTPMIRDAQVPTASAYVTLYDGTLPSPLEAGRFDTVTCVEVLEHIEDYEAAAAELARLTRDRLLLTTPDLSAIPLLHRHQVVPWHLLEATHVSLFTQRSLDALLRRHFELVEMFRIGPVSVNGTVFFTSLLARCRSPRTPVG
jgi:2-polyprenyl-3-methyl-5-hydroxy-6-metoxy-1,4-benzoquinol methylase